MRSIQVKFLEEMEFLKKYMRLQKNSYSMYFKSSSPADNDLKLPVTKIKQFNYNAYIISIYGAYENFIEQMMSEYLSNLCSIIPKFSELPEDIQKNNLIKTMDIIKKLDYPKYKNLSSALLVETLHKNINQNNSLLNIDVFKSHTANFKIKVIDTYFSDIGIKNLSQVIIKYSPLKEYLGSKYPDFLSIENHTLFKEIDYICEIRNEIAHGVQSINLLDETVLNEYIEFLILFSETLSMALYDKLYEIKFSLQGELFKPFHVYRQSILCFNTNGLALNLNSKVLLKKEDTFPKYSYANILEIRKDDESIENFEEKEPTNLSIEIDTKVNKRIQFKIET